MKIQKNPSVVYDNSRAIRKTNLTFTSDMLSLDLGATDPDGHGRVDYMDKKGNTLFSYEASLNYEGGGFKSHDDFTKKTAEFLDPQATITRRINDATAKLADESLPENLKEKFSADIKKLKNSLEIYTKRTPKEKEIRGITMFLPATVQEKNIQIMPNLRDADGKSLEEVDLKPVISKMQELGNMKFEKGFDLNKKFMPLKDLAASAASLASKLAKDNEYGQKIEKGFYASIVHCGGGWGAATLTIDGENVEIRTNESGHDPAISYVSGKEIRLGAAGASTPMVIENYATTLGVTDAAELKAIKATGMAQMATQRIINLPTSKHAKAIDALLKTGAYEVVNKGSQITTLKVSKPVMFERASRLAITAFADNVAQYAIQRIDRGFNATFISGPLALGLDEKIRQKPIAIKTKNNNGEEIKTIVNNMVEAVWARINARAAIDNTISGYKRRSNFEIICDKKFSVKDNNEAGAIFLSGETKGLLRRGEVAIFPIDVLKDLSKYTDPSIGEIIKKPIKNMLKSMLKHL